MGLSSSVSVARKSGLDIVFVSGTLDDSPQAGAAESGNSLENLPRASDVTRRPIEMNGSYFTSSSIGKTDMAAGVGAASLDFRGAPGRRVGGDVDSLRPANNSLSTREPALN